MRRMLIPVLAVALVLGLLSLLAYTLWERHRPPASLEELSAEKQEEFRSALEGAKHLMGHGDFDAAEAELEKCRALVPEEARVYDALGHLCLARRLHEESDEITVEEEDALVEQALDHLDRALALDPSLFSPHLLKFQIFRKPSLRRYDPEAALSEAEAVIRLDPENTVARQMLIAWLLSGARFPRPRGERMAYDSATGMDLAREHLAVMLEQIPQDNPAYPETIGKQGIVAICLGDLEGAEKAFRDLLALEDLPADLKPAVLRDLGYVLLRRGRYGDAAERLMIGMDTSKSQETAWLLRLALEGMGRDPDDLPDPYRFPLPREDGEVPGLRFQEAGAALGVDRVDGLGSSVFADLDGDGDPDLLVSGYDAPLALYRKEAERFRDVTGDAGLQGLDSGASVSLVDYDNDGHLDIYICRHGWNGPAPNTLMRNRGDGTFEDRTEEAGLGDSGSGSLALWADFDRDGDLDVFVTNGLLGEGSTSRLYRNLGTGVFEDGTEEAGLSESPRHETLGAAVGDYDRDGDPDIFVNGRFETPNRLYRNEGDGTFLEVAETAGVRREGHNGHMAFFLDHDNDAYPDILTTSVARWKWSLNGMARRVVPRSPWEVQRDAPRLFRNDRDGTFTDVTLQAGLAFPRGVGGGGTADLDNDGHVDLYLGIMDPDPQRLEPAVFYHNRGDGTFGDLSRLAGLGHLGKGGGFSFADLEGDGDLDIYAPRGGFHRGDHGANALYRNEAGNENHWIHIRLVGTESNRFAVGAQVTLRAGDLTQYREVQGGTDSYAVEFGLGQRDTVDTIEILWPSSGEQILRSPPVDSLIEVEESRDGWTVVSPGR